MDAHDSTEPICHNNRSECKWENIAIKICTKDLDDEMARHPHITVILAWLVIILFHSCLFTVSKRDKPLASVNGV